MNIRPVYVLGEDVLSYLRLEEISVESLSTAVLKDMKSRLSLTDGVSLSEPKVLKADHSSRREQVEILNQYLSDTSADLVFVNTHARAGVSRWFMGSFAENLLSKTRVPLIFLQPEARVSLPFRCVLWPTDFSKASLKALDQFLSLSLVQPEKLVIYSKVDRPMDSLIQSSVFALGGGWVAPEQYMSNEVDDRYSKGVLLKKDLMDRGYQVELTIDDGPHSLTEGAQQHSEQHGADLMVLSSSSGAFSSLLVGSVSRSLLRGVDLPAIVFHIES